MQLERTKQRLPYLDSAAYIIRQAVKIQQISAKSDSRVWFIDNIGLLAINRADYVHSYLSYFILFHLRQQNRFLLFRGVLFLETHRES